MTREEAKSWLKKLYMQTDITDEYGDMEDMQPYEEAVNMAIEALQEPFINKPCVSEGACKQHTDTVLDKIKSEIDEAYENYEYGYSKGLVLARQIIDKYIKEVEDKE